MLDWLSGIIYNTNMSTYLTVLDTNVLLAALRSKRGASYLLLSLFGTGKFEIALSVPLVLEYEAVIMRYLRELTVTSRDVSDILDYLCAIAKRQPIYYLWRPFLRDPKDDMLLELAVSASCQFIITFNLKDFVGIERFSLRAMTPKTFLEVIGVLP